MSLRIGIVALAVFALAACGKKDEPAADSSASAMAASAPAAPALSIDKLAGTWEGRGLAETGDSTVLRFTAIQDAAGSGKWVAEGSTDTIKYSSRVEGDSILNTSDAYTDKKMKGSPQMMWRTVARFNGDKLVGTSAVVLASKPDSVLSRGRWEATRK